jgi:hypothetical protein
MQLMKWQVEESLRLLPAAYDALFTLSDVRFSSKEDMKEKTKFYDRIMRQGILQGVDHSRQNGRIMGAVLVEMDKLIGRMGIHGVKHLKDVIPILSAALSDPFAPMNPDLLLLATNALKSTILNCWPRMKEEAHRMEIVKVPIPIQTSSEPFTVLLSVIDEANSQDRDCSSLYLLVVFRIKADANV